MKNIQLIVIPFLLMFFVLPLYAQKNLSAKENSIQTDKGEFLERFVGSWIGEGDSDEQKVRDEMKFEWAFDKRFLKLHYRALDGDKYKGEGYIWFNKELNQYEYYEFNNGRWAIRQGIGQVVSNSFVISEQRKGNRIRLTFEFINPASIKMTEVYVRKKGNQPFAALSFRRQTE